MKNIEMVKWIYHYDFILHLLYRCTNQIEVTQSSLFLNIFYFQELQTKST